MMISVDRVRGERRDDKKMLQPTYARWVVECSVVLYCCAIELR